MKGTALSGKKYSAYPEYKESGVNWLESIPNHWGVKPLKFQSSCNDEVINEKTNPDYKIEYIDIGSVSAVEGISKTEKMIFGNAPSRARRKVQDGDVIVSTVRTYLEAIAPIFNPPENMVVSTGFAVIRPKNSFHKGFASYCLRARGFIEEVVTRSVGVSYPAINATDLINIKIPFLPVYEQQKIANFLDHETVKIDTLIAKQEKLIELLKEKRQAVISHAVTRGLNPNAPMKDSGVEWLGEVPEHWKIPKLKLITQTTSGGTPSTAKYEKYYEAGTIPWIRTTDLNNGQLYETPIYITESALNDTACSLMPKKSMLLAMYGGAGSIGKHSLLMFESTINQAVCGIYPSNYYKPEFMHYFYEFYRPFWMVNAAGTRKDPNIGQDHIKEAKVCVPPLKEQKKIVSYLNKILTTFDNLDRKAKDAIELSKERKTALISATVTGKIDVRNYNTEKTGD